jgi:SAM-dependent methyltransferase
MRVAEEELRSTTQRLHALDIGCGAGRNTVPLARLGWHVLATDLSTPMLAAATLQARQEPLAGRIQLARAPMDHLPIKNGAADLVVAHGIWNLARSGDEFRRAVAEAARAAKPGAALFVFTFSRTTLPPDTQPVAGEPFVFTEFSGDPQCFLTAGQLISELAAAGFVADPRVALEELNRPRPGMLPTGQTPVIYQALFRRAT